MTQEKLKRVVTAAAVAGTLIVVCLLAVIVYQIVHMIVLDNRKKGGSRNFVLRGTNQERRERFELLSQRLVSVTSRA